MQRTVSNSLALIFGFLALAVLPASAQDCSNATSNAQMINCAFIEYEQVDADLNRTYQHLRGQLDTTAKLVLRDAQRAWIKFRDAECARHRDGVRGGTMEPLVEASCLTDMTRRRTQELSIDPLTGESIW